MRRQKQTDASADAAAEDFRAFFRPHQNALEQALAQFGIEPLRSGSDKGGYRFDLHIAPLDEKDKAAGYASVDVTITGHERGKSEDKEKCIVLWFVRFNHAGSWKLITRHGYLDWLLLQGGDPTQGVGPRLHVAIQDIFPATLEHYNWYQRRA